MSSHTALMTVTALFVTLYLVSNVMAVKVISIFGLFYFDAGTITFPFAYMLGDVLTEMWGFKTAKKVIWMTFFCNILMVLCTKSEYGSPRPIISTKRLKPTITSSRMYPVLSSVRSWVSSSVNSRTPGSWRKSRKRQRVRNYGCVPLEARR